MLKGILSISGQSGLFKLVSQTKNSIIVESLIDGKRFPAYSSSRVSALEDISIYTYEGDVKLAEVFSAIFEKNNGQPIDLQLSAAQLKTTFEMYLPDFDKERVYVSDIKKVLTWYNLLVSKDLINTADAEEMKTEADEATSESAE